MKAVPLLCCLVRKKGRISRHPTSSRAETSHLPSPPQEVMVSLLQDEDVAAWRRVSS